MRQASIYQELESVLKALCSLKQILDSEAAKELEISIERLKATLILFDKDSLLPAVAGQLEIYAARGTIERLGLSTEVLSLAASNKMSAKDIATRFKERGIEVSESSVRTFLDRYDKSSYADKVRLRTTSVFDSGNQLEKLLALINAQLARLNYATDPKQQEVHARYVSELRQTIKLAADLQIKLNETLERRRFQDAVKTAILSVCTVEQRERILQLLKDFGDPSAVASRAIEAVTAQELD